MPAHARRHHLAASNRHDAWDILPDISAPTLVVHGSDDQLNPTANAHLLTERIPNARLHLIHGARHAYFEEFRTQASPLVLDFLTTAYQP
ncbi:serine aminopeptidase domain-containing protein [Amycolatopsis taiwanensis]|uniref:serine aminopeptidase domain-containing protein n=1 Tax=Amycolatopsis taiwanensis TaxID=342230 RepID=UPI000489CDA8